MQFLNAWVYAPFWKIVENIKISIQDNQDKLALWHCLMYKKCMHIHYMWLLYPKGWMPDKCIIELYHASMTDAQWVFNTLRHSKCYSEQFSPLIFFPNFNSLVSFSVCYSPLTIFKSIKKNPTENEIFLWHFTARKPFNVPFLI